MPEVFKVTKIKDIPKNIIKVGGGGTSGNIVLGAGVIAVLFLISRKDEGGETIMSSIRDTIIEGGTSTVMETTKTIVETPGEIIHHTQEKVSEEVFMGEKKIISGEPLTYTEFMGKRTILTQTAAATGDIITGGKAAEYGKYVAEETKKIPGTADRFEELSPLGQMLVGFGQAITVPFYPSGAAGAGYDIEQRFKK